MNVELLQFLLAKGSGEVAIRRLLSFAEARGYAAAIELCSKPEALSKAIELKLGVCKNIVSSLDSARELYDRLLDNNVEMLWIGHHGYPERLRLILGKDCPPLIFVMGNRRLFDKNTVGFCGSRKASEKGL